MRLSDLLEILRRFPIAVGAGLLSLVLGFYLYFTMGSMGVLEETLHDLEREVQVLKTNVREGTTIEDDLNRFSALFEAVDARLMDHRQIATNNGYFYNFAQKHPVEILDVSQRPVVEASASKQAGDIWTKRHYSLIPFSMEVNGLITDIADMFYRWDTLGQLIEVRRFILTTTSKPEVGYMSMNLEVNVLGKPTTPAQGEGS
jgi:hypothetical protein